MVAAAIMGAGLIWFLATHDGLPPGDHIFSGEPKYFDNPVSMIRRAFEPGRVGASSQRDHDRRGPASHQSSAFAWPSPPSVLPRKGIGSTLTSASLSSPSSSLAFSGDSAPSRLPYCAKASLDRSPSSTWKPIQTSSFSFLRARHAVTRRAPAHSLAAMPGIRCSRRSLCRHSAQSGRQISFRILEH